MKHQVGNAERSTFSAGPTENRPESAGTAAMEAHSRHKVLWDWTGEAGGGVRKKEQLQGKNDRMLLTDWMKRVKK